MFRSNSIFTFHYASTYTFKVIFSLSPLIPFTFHYASTYTKLGKLVYCNVIILYIPLCFYLYEDLRSEPFSIAYLYIPLCFYLYDVIKCHSYRLDRLYIPLCFYLYDDGFMGPKTIKALYIPLCFYLYTLAKERQILDEQLYIPLCFYLYSCLFLPCIYIIFWAQIVHRLFSSKSHIKNNLSLGENIGFPLWYHTLSTHSIFYTLRSRQSQKIACPLIIHTPELFRNPLFISAFKNN